MPMNVNNAITVYFRGKTKTTKKKKLNEILLHWSQLQWMTIFSRIPEIYTILYYISPELIKNQLHYGWKSFRSRSVRNWYTDKSLKTIHRFYVEHTNRENGFFFQFSQHYVMCMLTSMFQKYIFSVTQNYYRIK